jgi:glutaredoxin-dependent peroxiredoxin
MTDVNSQAPDFTLLNTSREKVTLSELRGKKVVLAFFPAAFTGVCEKELCTFRDALADFNSLNATVLGISVDSPFSNGAFAAKNEINFPILSDYSRSAVAAYGVELNDFAGMAGYTASQRAVFVVGEDGKVTFKWVGDNPGQEPDYAAVQAAVS